MTLVEVLSVLAIIAITASVSVLALGSDDSLVGQAEAKRLEARLQLAADTVMIADTPMAIAITSVSYSFVERDDHSGEWVPSRDPILGEVFNLPSDMSLRSVSDASVFPLGATAAGQPFALNIVHDKREWQIVFNGMTARLAPVAPGPASS